MTRHSHALSWSGLVFLVGLVLAAAVVGWLTARQTEEASQRFADLARRATEQLSRRMQTYEYGLRGLGGVIVTLGPEATTHERILKYSRSRDYAREFGGARGFGFIRRVALADEARFLREARAEGRPGFAIRQLALHEGERMVIQYIEPEAGNSQAVGLDIASESNRLKAARIAILTGQATLTHPITLVQASGKVKRGFLLMLPTYRPGAPRDTPEEADRAAFGLVYAPLVIDEILAGFDFHNGEFSLALSDLDEAGKADTFYQSMDQSKAAGGLTDRKPLRVFGREWLVEIRAQPKFFAGLNHTPPLQVGLEIAGAGLLLAGAAYGQLLVRARKQDIREEQARLAAIVAASNDAIIGLTPEGRVTDWNPAAEAMFGYAARDAVGRRVVDLVLPKGREHEETELLARIAAGEVVSHFDTVRQRADGSLLHVSLTASPVWSAEGRVIGVAKTVRDVRACELSVHPAVKRGEREGCRGGRREVVVA